MIKIPYTKEQSAGLKEQTFAYLDIVEQDRVLFITLNRPAKKNALNPVMVNELAYAMSYARYQATVWVVVLKAEGDVFCAGADLKAFMGGGEISDSSIPPPGTEVLIGELFNKLFKPCIAQVEGHVYAGGFLLLAGCSHVIAPKGIKLGLPEVKRGLFPFQVMAGLLEIMPPRKVLDWCIRGYNLPIAEAHQWGLITHLTTLENVPTMVKTLLQEILANSPTAIRKGLEAYDHIRPLKSAENHQYLRDMLMQTLGSEDAREGINAFREKRLPKWTNI